MQKTKRHWWKKSKMTYKVGEIYHVLGVEESIFWKWLNYSNQSTDSMQSLSNYQWLFLTELEQNILQFVWKHKWPQIAKTILRKKNIARGIRLPDFRLYKAIVFSTVLYRLKTRNILYLCLFKQSFKGLDKQIYFFQWIVYEVLSISSSDPCAEIFLWARYRLALMELPGFKRDWK